MLQHTTDDGCRLAYRVDGPADAPALVLSNSLGTDCSLWDRQIDAFAARFRVVRYDTRGHGESDAPPGAYTVERLGRDVLSLMDASGLARAHVCGVSLGGVTAMWLGVHAAARVDRLVLANTAARIGSIALWDGRIRSATSEGLEALADSAMDRWFTAAFRSAEPETIERMRAIMRRTPVAGYTGCCAALREADLRPAVSGIRAPCLVISATRDVATPPADGAWLAATIPGAQLVTLDAAHLTNVECAAAFTSAVSAFLQEPLAPAS